MVPLVPQLATFDVRLGRVEVEVFVDVSLDEGGDRNESDEKEEESDLHLVWGSWLIMKEWVRVSSRLANFQIVKFGGYVDGCEVRWAQ